MKRLSWLYVLLMFVGCTESSIEDNFVIGEGSEEFYASIESANSRTYVDEQIRMRWHAEDRITIFKKETYNREFKFTGKTGANAGGFTQVSEDDDFYFGYAVNANYAVYPHSTDTELDETDCFFTLTMPAEQSYAENTFGQNANTMVAVSETGNLMFKNVGCYLRVRLYGENTNISSVTLTTKGDEAIAGEAKVTPSMDGNPTCEMTGTGKSIRLICETPVAISSNADAPTDFWIVVPPVTLADGFSVTVKDENDNAQVYDVNQSFTFERNKYYDMVREFDIKQISHYSDGVAFVAKAGELSLIIPEDEKYTIETLKISGELNGTDIRFIREIAGGNYTNATEGKPLNLDLSDANIVEGGDAYYSTYEVSNNEIGYFMFSDCVNLKSVILPDNATTIDQRAFQNCDVMTTITIGNGISSISRYAFFDCDALSTVYMGNKVSIINFNAFQYCDALESVYINDLSAWCKINNEGNPLRYGKKLYWGNQELSELIVPEDVTAIGDYCFIGLQSLIKVEIPNHVTSIGNSTFSGCSSLTSVSIGEGVTSIGDSAFSGCSSLMSVSIGEGVTSIGAAAFDSCSLLTSVTIPNGVTLINNYSFKGCI